MNTPTKTLIDERAALVRAELDSYSAENFPGSRAWKIHREAVKAVNAFDAAHPEVVAEITTEKKARQEAEYGKLSDFVKLGS